MAKTLAEADGSKNELRQSLVKEQEHVDTLKDEI